jgi:hypothetical protein
MALSREQMFEVFEPSNAIKGVADAEFVGLVSKMHWDLAPWAINGHCRLV